MKKQLLFVLLICASQTIFTQIPTYQWAYSIGDVNQEYLNTLKTDSENNIIIAGDMYGTTDMNPTEFLKILTSNGGLDAYIVKFDADGNVAWGINFGGTNYDGIVNMAIDQNDNIYVIGYFAGTADLNPDMVDQKLVVSNGGYDMFLAKFDKNGVFVWGQSFGALGDDWINNLTIDENDNLYITGQFSGTVDFDGSDAGELSINSTLDKYDGFVAKYNLDGAVSWAFRIGGFDDDISNEIAVNHDGDIIVTGTFQGTADFTGQFLDAADGTLLGWPKEGDAYIAKYDNEANLKWAKSIKGDTGFNGGYSNTVQALALDNDDNIIVTGLIYGKADFDMGDDEHLITTFADYDSYFAKYDTEGNFVWSYVTAPKVVGYNLDLLVDYNNDIYLAGDYNYSTGIPYEADFDVDPDSIYMLQGHGEKDAYIAKYNANAEILWAYSVGGSGWEFATAIDLDNDLNICVGGWFYNTTDFDANPDSNFIWLPYIEPTYGNNVWMGKYDQDVLVPVAINNNEILNNTMLIAPNPAVDFINLYFSNQVAAGETIIIKDITGKIAGQYSMRNKLEINNLSPGIYFIQAGNLVTQFVKL